jgi:fatty acid desaturase
VSTEPEGAYTRLVAQRASGARTIVRGIVLLLGTVAGAALLVAFGHGALWPTIYAVIVAISGGMIGVGHLVVGHIERRDAVRQLRGLVPQARLLSGK